MKKASGNTLLPGSSPLVQVSLSQDMAAQMRAWRIAIVSEARDARIDEGGMLFSMTGERGEDHEGREFIIPPPVSGRITKIRLSSEGEALFDVAFRVPHSVLREHPDIENPEDTFIDIIASLSEEQISDSRKYSYIMCDSDFHTKMDVARFIENDLIARPLGLTYGSSVTVLGERHSFLGREGYISSHRLNSDDEIKDVSITFSRGTLLCHLKDILDPGLFRIRPVELISGLDPLSRHSGKTGPDTSNSESNLAP